VVLNTKHATRVLVVTKSVGTLGGIEQSITDLLPRLEEHAIDVSLLVAQPSPADATFRDRGIAVDTVEGETLTGRARNLPRLLQSRRPHVVHLSPYNPGLNLPVSVEAAAMGLPRLTSLVSPPIAHKAGDTWRRRLVVGADRRLLRAADYFHAVSHAVKEAWSAAKGITPDKIIVVERGRSVDRLGTPSEARRTDARAALGLPPRAEVVLTVGRQSPEKGQVHLVDAVAALVRHRPDIELLIVGPPGGASAALKARRANCGDPRRIHLLGGSDAVPDLLAASDVFVLPSLYEGMSGALIEAMAMGLPVVASDLGGVREAVNDGEGALLVPVGDAAAIAAAIEQVLDSPDLAASLGSAGRRRFHERFTLERIAPRMAALYRYVAARGPRWRRRPAA
jgi:glycosyltransferase involved in cell wall biosynthesis